MGTARWRWSLEILLWRTRAAESTTRSGTEALLAAIRWSELRTRATLRRTLLHPIPSRPRTTIGSPGIKLRAALHELRARMHRSAHLIFTTTTKVLRATAARRESVVVHHPALVPEHPIGTLAYPRIAGTTGSRTASLFHLRRTRSHSRSRSLSAKSRTLIAASAIGLRAFGIRTAPLLHLPRTHSHSRSRSAPTKSRTLLTASTIRLRRWAKLIVAVFASLILRTPSLRALISPATAAELSVARTRLPLLRRIGPVRVGTAWFALLRRGLRALGRIVLGAERPRGKREGGCSD